MYHQWDSGAPLRPDLASVGGRNFEAIGALYGDTIKRVVYGNKFTMEMEKVAQENVTLTFWTNAKFLEKSSIIYVPEDRQWWKVSSCIEQENGFLIQTITSDQTPSFI